jgi:hypothetical protein
MFELPRRSKKLAAKDLPTRVSELLGDVGFVRDATRCPVCGCDATGPRCTVVLADGAGVLPCCSACEPNERDDRR